MLHCTNYLGNPFLLHTNLKTLPQKSFICPKSILYYHAQKRSKAKEILTNKKYNEKALLIWCNKLHKIASFFALFCFSSPEGILESFFYISFFCERCQTVFFSLSAFSPSFSKLVLYLSSWSFEAPPWNPCLSGYMSLKHGRNSFHPHETHCKDPHFSPKNWNLTKYLPQGVSYNFVK